MDADLKKILKAVVLEMRHELEGHYDKAGKWFPGDLEQRLAEIGVRKDRESAPVDELALADEDVAARKIIDAYISLRQQAGVDRADAVAEYVRESAYTWANRLVALRCMEARELLDDEVIVGREAYGGRSLVHHRLAQTSPELCTGEDDGRFAMLSSVFAERAETLPMLFDPESPSIALRPSPPALKNCFAWLSGSEKVRSHEPATDAVFAAPDALGWAYQYWNTEEKDRVFETVRTKKGAKIEGADIIPATQLYTEDYMVKFLVQNSLGATWMGMHPESQLLEGWEYYVRDADRAPAKEKPLRQITLLDPACGSGHFLIEAFEMFYSMYEEEGEITEPEGICKSILEDNLFGIDIDERAIQIAEASLWMKAEEKAFGFSGATTNLVAATSSHLKGESWERFLATLEKEPSVVRVLRKFAKSIEHIDELGSLARPAEDLKAIIKDEHRLWEEQVRTEKEANFLFPDMVADALDGQLPFDEITDEQFGHRMLNRAIMSIDGFTREAKEDEFLSDQLLGGEAKDRFRLLKILDSRFDVLVANPPYMGTTQLAPSVNAAVVKHASSPDLYCALMLRWLDLQKDGGIAALVTRADYLTQSECEAMREELLDGTSLNILVRLENKVFRDLSNPNAIFFSMQIHTVPSRENALITAAAVDKGAFETKAEELKNVIQYGGLKPSIPQRAFANLPRATFAMGLPDWSYTAFVKFPRVSTFANAVQGLITGDTSRYLRFRWEIRDRERWRTYAKGGEFCRWFGNDTWAVDWQDDGTRLRNFINKTTGRTRSRVQNTQYYFRRGASWSSQTVSAFAARMLENASVFDTTGSSVFLSELIDTEENFYRFLGLLNSPAYGLMFRSIQPGVHYGEGYLETLPFPQPESLPELLGELARRCVEKQKAISINNPCSSMYRPWQTIKNGMELREAACKTLKEEIGLQAELYENELELWRIAEELLGVPEPEKTASVRNREQTNADVLSVIWQATGSPTASPQRATQNGFEEACVLSGNSPKQAASVIRKLESQKVPDEVLTRFCENLMSSSVLQSLGYDWDYQSSSDVWAAVDDDGLIPLTSIEKESTLQERVKEGFANEEFDIDSFPGLFDSTIDDWLVSEFFKHHTKQFKKRPIAWQLQSSSFTIRKTPAFACLTYYRRIDVDAIPKIRTQYTGPLKLRFETEMRGISSTPAASRTDNQAKRAVELEEAIAELQAFDNKLATIAKSGFGPAKLLPTLRQYAFDDAMLALKARWLKRLSELLDQSPGEEAVDGMREASPLDQWQGQAIETGLHPELAGWIGEALSKLDYFCSQVGPRAPAAKKTPNNPTATDFAELIRTETATMQTSSIELACGAWWGKFDAAVLAPIKERIKTLKAEQKELNAAIKEDRQPVLDADTNATVPTGDTPLLSNDGPSEQTTELTRAAMKARLKEVKAKIKKFNDEMKLKAGKAQAIRDAIQAWNSSEPGEWHDWLAEGPMFDQVASLDERRSPPKTIAEFIDQESLYAPDINDGVRVNIAPLQKAGVLAADVLAAKDLDKAIADRAEWRSDERRWVREGKLPQCGWWPEQKAEGGGIKDE